MSRISTFLVLAAILVAALSWGWIQMRVAQNLRQENAALVRQAEAAKAAEAMARDQLARERQRTANMIETLEQLRESPDAPLPPRTRDLLRRLP